jgi:hypothetical protein
MYVYKPDGNDKSTSLSEALLLFHEEVKTPKKQGNTEIRIKRLTTLLNTYRGSVVVCVSWILL